MNILKTYFFAEIAKFYRLLAAEGTKPIFWMEKLCQGREKRKNFWLYFLFTMVGITILGFLTVLISSVFLWLFILYALFLLLPTLSIAGRRLHDANFSAWWLLLILIPTLGQVVLLVLYALPSTEGPNRFEENN